MTPSDNASAESRRASRKPAADHSSSDNSALVRLRPFTEANTAWLDGWLGDVAAAVRYDAIDRAEPVTSLVRRLRDERSLRARIIEREGVDAGIILYRVHQPRRGCGMFEMIGVPDAHARRGSGTMGAVDAERELLQLGVRTAYAPAPEAHGIAVYFWIRLGYAPLQRSEWPCERPGVLWLRRELSASSGDSATKPSL